MRAYQVTQLRSVQELRSAAAAWDDLWWRSDVAVPTARAELVAQWLEHFAPRSWFKAVIVEQDGKWLAALPLVSQQPKKLFPVGGLPSNPWSVCGDLLLDPAADAQAVLNALLGALAKSRFPLLWFDRIDMTSARWQALVAAASRQGLACTSHLQEQVGQVQISGDWAEYEAARSGNHRRHIRKAQAKLDRAGATELKIHHSLEPAEVDNQVRRAFEVEDRSWKGAAGTSVLRCPGMFEFHCGQARQLAAWGQLEISFLEHDGRPISFQYGYTSKGVYFCPKVGYDEEFAANSPGQVLLGQLLKHYYAGGQTRLVDFAGPLQDWTGKWTTHSYPLGRLVIAPQYLISRLLLQGYISGRPLLARLRECRGQRAGSANAEPPSQPVPA